MRLKQTISLKSLHPLFWCHSNNNYNMKNWLRVLYSPEVTTDCGDVSNPLSTSSCNISDELEDSISR